MLLKYPYRLEVHTGILTIETIECLIFVSKQAFVWIRAGVGR